MALHAAVFLLFKKNHREGAKLSPPPNGARVNKADFGQIRHTLSEIDWNDNLSGLDACEAGKVFNTLFKNVQESCIPLKYKRERKMYNPPWLT